MPMRSDPRTGRRAARCRSRPGPRSRRRCARRSASTRTPRFSNTPPPATPPCHRTRRYARHGDAPTAPPPPSVHGWGSSPVVLRPPAPPAPRPNPGRATRAGPHRGHTRAPCGHSGVKHHFAAAPEPPPAWRPRRLPLRIPRTRCPQSPCAGRHPAAHAITSHCARRCPLLWFLTFDKPETLSHNDVRLFTSIAGPRKRQRSN
uniref:Uncharacterized protein n=1 Tax=Mycobacterium riyadhense TaxID=486698 RepID=A0A653EYR2_9MYCO|nr:hypothetical protein BIN_B_04571 [Mycobacterium riyadhense]